MQHTISSVQKQLTSPQNPFKRRLFLLLEDPSSSNTAFALNVWVSMAIVISAVITTIETIPSFRSTDNKIWYVEGTFTDIRRLQLDLHHSRNGLRSILMRTLSRFDSIGSTSRQSWLYCSRSNWSLVSSLTRIRSSSSRSLCFVSQEQMELGAHCHCHNASRIPALSCHGSLLYHFVLVPTSPACDHRLFVHHTLLYRDGIDQGHGMLPTQKHLFRNILQDWRSGIVPPT